MLLSRLAWASGTKQGSRIERLMGAGKRNGDATRVIVCCRGFLREPAECWAGSSCRPQQQAPDGHGSTRRRPDCEAVHVGCADKVL